MARNYAALPHEYLAEMEELDDAEFGRLCRALLAYSKDGTPIVLSGNERFYAKIVMARENYYQEGYEEKAKISRENGKKGGRPRKTDSLTEGETQNNLEKPTETQHNPVGFSKTQKTQNKNNNKNENENQNQNEEKNKNNSLSFAAAAAAKAAAAEGGEREKQGEQGALAYYREKIGTNLSREAENLLPRFVQDMGDEVVMCAVDEALDNDAKRWAYVKAILQEWARAGVHDLPSLEQHRLNRVRPKSQGTPYSGQSGQGAYNGQGAQRANNGSGTYSQSRPCNGGQNRPRPSNGPLPAQAVTPKEEERRRRALEENQRELKALLAMVEGNS